MNLQTLGALAALALLTACAGEDRPMTTGTGAGMGTAVAIGSSSAGGTEEDLKQNVGDRVYFDFDRALLRPDARATLDRQAAWLGKYAQVNVEIAGNCDERGTEEYNIALGQRRANTARTYLVAKGVSATRITAISYGKDRPVAVGSNDAAWKQNRNAITEVK